MGWWRGGLVPFGPMFWGIGWLAHYLWILGLTDTQRQVRELPRGARLPKEEVTSEAGTRAVVDVHLLGSNYLFI